MRSRNLPVAVLLLLVLTTSVCLAMIGIHPGGTWPDNWPPELQPLREQAKTYDVGTGIQETMYQIFFSDRAQFERVWPAILTLKSTGGTLTLVSPDPVLRTWYDVTHPSVCIWDSVRGGPLGIREGDEMRYIPLGPPWPDSAREENGNLAEYVDWDGEQWVPTRPGPHVGFIFRARMDITLIVDGNVIDLNRIRLPADTLVIDKRTLPPDPAATQPPEVFNPRLEEAEEALRAYLGISPDPERD